MTTDRKSDARRSQPSMLEAIERVELLATGHRAEPWTAEQLAERGRAAVQLWRQARERLQLDVSFGGDAVAHLDPSFALVDGLADEIVEALGRPNGQYAVRFLKWALCPLTAEVPNPFGPLLEIIEHGGGLHVEHAMFLDIHAADGQAVGIPLLRGGGSA